MAFLKDYTGVPTKANTKLSPWWKQLNAELESRGQDEALFREARDLYETGHTPRLAANEIQVDREWRASNGIPLNNRSSAE